MDLAFTEQIDLLPAHADRSFAPSKLAALLAAPPMTRETWGDPAAPASGSVIMGDTPRKPGR